jgi:predicted nucleic acid-binding protein
MAKLVDTSLWIDLSRARSPETLKQFVAKQLVDTEICLSEPIIFEVLRHANNNEIRLLTQLFAGVPVLATPGDVWSDAAQIGRNCRKHGFTVAALDLLIATIAVHHGAEILTFDDDFIKIAEVSPLRVTLLKRPIV